MYRLEALELTKEDSGMSILNSEPGVFNLGGLEIKKMDRIPKNDKLNQKCPHKKTDFRYKIWVKERKALKQKAKKNGFRVELGPQPRRGPGVVTVDTSKARSNVDVVRLCLKELGWREYPIGKRDGGPCDIYWHGVSYYENPEIISGRVNKFPGMIEIARKINLTRTLDIMANLFPEEYNFHPQSWFLPQQYAEFADISRRMISKGEKPVYIVKPDEGSQGDGIYLIHDAKDYVLSTTKRHIVQEYLADPLLLEDLKFDFRLYVLIANLDPLQIYLYDDGLARFCTVPYEAPTNKNLHQAYMHLTNYSLNKKSETYKHTDNDCDGSKRTVSSVMKVLEDMGHDREKLWSDIQRLVAKTVIAMAPELKVEYRAEVPPGKNGPNPFQILGFDILLLKNLKPMLLEVNSSPSMRIDFEKEVATGITEKVISPVDDEVKRNLVLDTLRLIAPPKAKFHRHSLRHRSLSKPRNKKHVRRRSKSADRVEDTGSSEEESDRDDKENLVNNNIQEPIREGCSLQEIFPALYGEEYMDILLMDRTVDIYLQCLGVRGALRMGNTQFRNFTRKCNVVGHHGFTNAALDIVFIDLQRRWEYVNSDRAAGLCYQGFLEAFFMIARKMYSNADNPLQSVVKFLDHSEKHMEFGHDHKLKHGQLPPLKRYDKKIEELRSTYYGNPKKTGVYIDIRSNPADGSGKHARRKPRKMRQAAPASEEESPDSQ